MRLRLSLVLLAAAALVVTSSAGPLRAADMAYPIYKGIACNADGPYLCGGLCPPDRCYCCEKPVKVCY